MGDKYVTDIITWNDIASHKVTAIYSGVGSGKNHFTEKMITEGIEGQTEPKKVLLLTSRRAKVEETIPELEDVVSSYIGLEGNVPLSKIDWWDYNYGFGGLPKKYLSYEVDKDKKILNRSVVCTYAKIEPVLHKIYANDLDLLYGYNSIFWEWFDLIVIDEVHSLVMDAGYQSAPFHIFNMIKAFNESCTDPNKHLIVMTGTPQPIDTILRDICPDICVIDLFDNCINIVPSEIRFIDVIDLKHDIQQKLYSGKKVIYFYNGSILTSKDFCNDTEIDESIVACSFSNQDARDDYKAKNESAFARMVYTEDSLTKSHKLPDAIQMLLTTSRLKEGINVVDDIDYIYVDTHLPADVIQMAGRVRTGNHILYIVVDAYQFDDPLAIEQEKLDIDNDKLYVSECNKYLHSLEETSDKIKYIDDITQQELKTIDEDGEEKTTCNLAYRPYIRFNFFTNEFEFYTLKKRYFEYKMSNIDAWNNCDINKPSSLKRLVSKWFPDTVLIDNYESKSYKSLRLFKSKYRFQVDSKYDKDKYTKAKIDQFIKDLQNIWHKDNTQLRYYLKLFMPDVYLKQCGKSKKLYRFVTKQ